MASNNNEPYMLAARQAMLEKSKENRLVRNALEHGGGIRAEAEELFYFFEQPPYMRTPELRPDHDYRLHDLVDAMQGVNLRTKEDVKEACGIQQAIEEMNPVEAEKFEQDKEYVTMRSRLLSGMINQDIAAGLRSDKLGLYLECATNVRRARIALGGFMFAAGFAIYPKQDYKDVIAATAYGGLGLALFLFAGGKSKLLENTPPVYRAIKEKAIRMDALATQNILKNIDFRKGTGQI